MQALVSYLGKPPKEKLPSRPRISIFEFPVEVRNENQRSRFNVSSARARTL